MPVTDDVALVRQQALIGPLEAHIERTARESVRRFEMLRMHAVTRLEIDGSGQVMAESP